MKQLIKASVAALTAWALALAPLCAQETTLGSGVWGDGLSRPAYVQNSVHIDQGSFMAPITTSFTAGASWAANTTAITVSSCPTGWALGQAIFDTKQGSGAQWLQGPLALVGYVGACSGTTLTAMMVKMTVNTGGSYSAHNATGTMTWTGTGCTVNPVLSVSTNGSGVITNVNSVSRAVCQTVPSNSDSADWSPSGLGTQTTGATFNTTGPLFVGSSGSADPLLLSGPVASVDNCQFIFSGWWRSNIAVNILTSSYTDLFSSGYAPPPSQAEQSNGIDVVFDVGGMRFNYANKNVIAGGGSNNVDVVSLYLYPAPYLHYGQWNHILWTSNACNTNSQYSQAYINGVQALNSHTTNTFSAPIYFSNPSGGFNLAMPSPYDTWSWGEWADVMLWTGTDLVCQHGTWTSGCSLGGSSISAADLALFGQNVGGIWLPKNPSVAVAALGGGTDGSKGLLVELTGNAASWGTNQGVTSPGTTYQVVTSGNYGGPGIVDNPGSASRVTSSFPSGNPAHRAGWQWGCTVVATNITTQTTSACGQTITSGDLLVAIYTVSNSTGSFTCPQPTGWQLAISSYNATANMFECINTHVAGVGETGAYSANLGANGNRDLTMLVDYGPATADVAGSAGSYSTFTTNITAPSITTVAANDMLIGIFVGLNSYSGPFACPPGMTKRWDVAPNNPATTVPGFFICDKQLGAAGATGTQTATRGSTPQYFGGMLMSLAPN